MNKSAAVAFAFPLGDGAKAGRNAVDQLAAVLLTVIVCWLGTWLWGSTTM